MKKKYTIQAWPLSACLLLCCALFSTKIVHAQPVVSLAGGSGCSAITLTSSLGPAQIVWKKGSSAVQTTSAGWAANASTAAGGNGSGTSANQFASTHSVMVDGSGNIYISDGNNNRVQKWASGATSGTTVAGGNGAGTAANQLDGARQIYVDGSGNVYVADVTNNRVQKWAAGATTGTTVAGGNGAGSAANQLNGPFGVYLDGSNNIYIGDQNNNRIQKWAPGATAGTTVAGGNGSGTGATQFNTPRGVFVDASGNIYICDALNNRVQEWASGATTGTTVAGQSNGTSGVGASQLNTPRNVYVDGNGNVYVADVSNNRIQQWAAGATSGTTVAGQSNGTSGVGANYLSSPYGVWLDANGNIYVGDASNVRVQEFAPNTSMTYTPASSGSYTAVITSFAGTSATTAADVIAAPAAPSITSVSPMVAYPGASITITGTVFNSVAANNIVFFGATMATVNTASATSLSVTLPAGGTYRDVSVINTCSALTAYSQYPFLPSYDNSGLLTGVNFSAKVDFTTGSSPQTIATGDLDGDGKADIAVVNAASNTVSVFRNTSTSGSITSGSFAAKVDFTTGSGPVDVTIADIDGDGKPELVVTNTTSGTISVFRNTATSGSISSSSFAAKVDFTTGSTPDNAVIGDLDGDGKPDMAVTNILSNTISVYRNTGSIGSISSSTFAAKVDFTAGTNPAIIEIADLDGDGKPDLAVINNGANSVSVFRNTSSVGSISSSSFAAKVDFTTGSSPSYLALGDIDGDGKPEMVVANRNSNSVSVLRNTATSGSITSASFASKVDFAAGTGADFVAIGDLDGDGKPDLATANDVASTVSLLRNTSTSGSITSSSFAAKVDLTGANVANAVAVGDLDGDGKADLAVANYGANTFSVFRNNPLAGNSTFVSSNPQTLSVAACASATSIVSLLHVSNSTSGQTETWSQFAAPSHGTLTFTSATAASGSSNITPGGTITYTPTGSYTGTDAFTVQVNDGTGTANMVVNVTLTAAAALSITGVSPMVAYPAASVTISGTGFNSVAANDIVFFGATMATVSTASATSLSVLLPIGATYNNVSVINTCTALTAYSQYPFLPSYNNSGFLFGVNVSSHVDFTAGTSMYGIAIGDVDGDGKADLVVTNSVANTVSVFRNTSTSGSITSGSFAAKVDFTTGSGPALVSIGDLDGDGKPELVVSNQTSNTISIFHNTSSISSITSSSFAAKVDFTTGTSPCIVAIGDLDGDGKPDLAVPNISSGTVSVFRNTGSSGSITSASFAAKVDFTTGSSPAYVAMGDLDGDGKPDLAVPNVGSNTVSVFRNTSSSGSITSASFAAKVDFATGASPTGVAIGDLDGDGKADLSTSNNGTNTISVLRNTAVSGSITSGSFATKVDFTVGSTPNPVAIGDIDGDGKPDLIISNYGSDNVSILRNTSSSGSITSASFASKVDFSTGTSSGPAFVAVGDLDGDGKPDIAVANYGVNTISILRNSPLAANSSFINSSPQALNVCENVTAQSIVSILHVSNTTSSQTETWSQYAAPSHGTLTFTSATAASGSSNITPGGTITYTPTASYTGADAFTVQVNDGTGTANTVVNVTVVAPAVPTITSVSPMIAYPAASVTITGTNFSSIAANDIVFFGATMATVSAASATSLSVTLPVDATYDNVSVLVSTGCALSAYSQYPFLPSYNNSSYAPGTNFSTHVDFTSGTNPAGITIGDLDGDGKADIAVANFSSATISVYRNTSSSGSLTSSSFAAKVDFATATQPNMIVIGDLDGDGKPDMAVANYGSNSVSVLRNTSTSGAITSGSFATKVDFTVGTNPWGIAIGDLDGDGKPDLATGNYTTNNVSVLRNTSTSGAITSGSFATKVDFTAGSQARGVQIGDLDGDGKPELVVGNYGANTISVFFNTSSSGSITSGSFAAKVDFAITSGPCFFTIGDLDGDGKPEIVVPNYGSTTVSVLRNTATSGSITSASFAAKVDFTVGTSPLGVAIADMDGDGKPDLVTSNSNSTTVSVLRNTSTSGSITSASFAAKTDFTIGAAAWYIAGGDLDGDGKADIVTANFNANTVSILRNSPLTITWTGTTSNNWNTSSNWVGRVPIAGDSVSIPGSLSVYPVISSGTSALRTLTMGSGATLSISSGAELDISSNLINAGTVSGAGKVTLNGTSAQSISGTGIFSNLEINNSAGVTLNAATTISSTGSVLITSGTFHTGAYLTLASDASGDARIAQIGGSGAISSDNITIQKYIPGQRSYRTVTNLFTTTKTLSALTGFLDVTGSGGSGNGFSVGGHNSASAYYFVPSNDGTGTNSAWQPFTSANGGGNNNWNPGQAILLFVRGTPGQGLNSYSYNGVVPGNVTISLSGPVNTGSSSLTYTLTPDNLGNGHGDGWHIIGNPLPSQINVDAIVNIGSVDDDIQVLDPRRQAFNDTTNSTGYRAKTVSGALTVPMWGAFMAHNSSTTTNVVLQFPESCKVSSTAAANFFRTTNSSDVLELQVFKDSAEWDDVQLRFIYGASGAASDVKDVKKFGNDVLDFYTLSQDGKELLRDARDPDSLITGYTIPMGITSVLAYTYKIVVTHYDKQAGKDIYLHDKYTNTMTLLDDSTSYSVTINADSNSQGQNRLELLVGNAPIVSNSGQLKVYPNPAANDIHVSFNTPLGTNTVVEVLNAAGQVVKTVSASKGMSDVDISLAGLSAGVYFIKTQAGGRTVAERFIKN